MSPLNSNGFLIIKGKTVRIEGYRLAKDLIGDSVETLLYVHVINYLQTIAIRKVVLQKNLLNAKFKVKRETNKCISCENISIQLRFIELLS